MNKTNKIEKFFAKPTTESVKIDMGFKPCLLYIFIHHETTLYGIIKWYYMGIQCRNIIPFNPRKKNERERESEERFNMQKRTNL